MCAHPLCGSSGLLLSILITRLSRKFAIWSLARRQSAPFPRHLHFGATLVCCCAYTVTAAQGGDAVAAILALVLQLLHYCAPRASRLQAGPLSAACGSRKPALVVCPLLPSEPPSLDGERLRLVTARGCTPSLVAHHAAFSLAAAACTRYASFLAGSQIVLALPQAGTTPLAAAFLAASRVRSRTCVRCRSARLVHS
jgi:hypothetical protein